MNVWQVRGVRLSLEKNNGVPLRKRDHVAFLNSDINETNWNGEWGRKQDGEKIPQNLEGYYCWEEVSFYESYMLSK